MKSTRKSNARLMKPACTPYEIKPIVIIHELDIIHFHSVQISHYFPALVCVISYEIYVNGSIVQFTVPDRETTCALWQHFFAICPLERTQHDGVIKWKHFPHYRPFVQGIHRSPVNSPHKGQWRGALMFSLICAWINSWVNTREAGDLRRHRAHYEGLLYPILVLL